jgi:hypothetical protein
MGGPWRRFLWILIAMKLKAIITALAAVTLTAGIAEDALAQQRSRSGSRTQSTTRKTTTRHRSKAKPASVNQGPIVPVDNNGQDPKVTMPLLPEPQRNPSRVQIVPAQPPGTVPQPPTPPHPDDMPPQQR